MNVDSGDPELDFEEFSTMLDKLHAVCSLLSSMCSIRFFFCNMLELLAGSNFIHRLPTSKNLVEFILFFNSKNLAKLIFVS